MLALMKAEGDADLMQFTVCFFFVSENEDR